MEGGSISLLFVSSRQTHKAPRRSDPVEEGGLKAMIC